MPEIVKITCGTLPRVMPDGSTAAADYSELTVTETGAELVRYQGDARETVPIRETVFRQTALEETAALIAAHPDTPAPEPPLASQVTYRDGTVKYAPPEELSRILQNLKLLLTLQGSELVQPQGLVCAPNPAMRPQGMALFQMMQETPQIFAPTEWHCACGAVNTGKFCQNCGSPKP